MSSMLVSGSSLLRPEMMRPLSITLLVALYLVSSNANALLPALPTIAVDACLQFGEDETVLTLGSRKALDAFVGFVDLEQADLAIDLERNWPRHNGRPFIAPPVGVYSSSDYIDKAGRRHRSESRVVHGLPKAYAAFVSTSLSPKLLKAKSIVLYEARTSGAPRCNVDLRAFVPAAPGFAATSVTCTPDGCRP